jgi:hypothetical protein
MALTWPFVHPVKKGDRITSAQMIALADSWNARIRSGLGNIAWRVNKYFENYFRQVRNPDETGFNFPPQGEFFFLYQLIDGDKDGQWPDSGPGEPEGANLANPLNQFVFGNPVLDSEDNRLGNAFPLWLDSGAPGSLAEIWELGKAQRGAIAASGEQFTPALSAALSWLDISTPYYSPQGKTYGGKFPSAAQLLPGCDNPGGPYEHTPSVQIVFTNTVTGAVVTYPGTCPHGSDFGGAGQVLFIVRIPIAYYVAVDDGTGAYNFEVYPIPTWIEGPYASEPFLAHSAGEHTERMLWNFIKDFRGSITQRADDTFKIKNLAWDNQAFLTRQYPLAPNFGVLSGTGIEPQYPTARIDANAAADSFVPFLNPAGAAFTLAPGFVLGGLFAAATNLALDCTLNVLDQTGAILGSLTLAAGATSEAMIYLTDTVIPTSISVQLATPAIFSGTGSLQFECAQLYPMRPQFWDAYLVLRETATRGGFDAAGVLDGSGIDETGAKAIYDSLAANGCVLNAHGTSGPTQIENSITSNPGYDAMRRWSRDCMRIVQRQSFLSYEVAGGKSILRFKRYAYGASEDLKADIFFNIAPPYQPVAVGTELTPGETYVVRGSGTVKYNEGFFADGDTFTVLPGTTGWWMDPDPHYTRQLYIYDGIRPVAFSKGLTNEWVLHLECHPYHWSESSQWKATAYADYFTGINRCHFQSGSISADSAFGAHVNFSPYNAVTAAGSDPDTFLTSATPEAVQAQFYNPEAPDGYNYMDNSNHDADIPFYKSCQIYAAPYEIEHAIVEISGGIETVVLTLATRLRAHDSAPATVNPDPSTWSDPEISALRNTEDYRTDDNALREYALLQSRGLNATWKTGDSGTLSFITHLPDNPYGCVFPKFFITKLLGKPPEDGNDTQEPSDTRCTVDLFQHAEIFTFAGCEGFVDGRVTSDLACRTGLGGLYDYNFKNLCFHAFGGSNLSPLDPAVRNDAAGYSAAVMTKPYASQYNQLAACLNLLTKARIELPMKLESKLDVYLTNYEITPSIVNPSSCANGATTTAIWTGSPADPALQTPGTWGDWAGDGASCSAGFSAGTPWCDAGGYNFASTKSVLSYRSAPLNADALNAIPLLLQDLMVNGGTGFLAFYSDETDTTSMGPATGFGDATVCSGTTPAWDGTNYYKFTLNTRIDAAAECRLLSAGVLDTGTAPAGVYALIHDSSGSTAGACNFLSSRSIAFAPFGSAASSYFEVPLV